MSDSWEQWGPIEGEQEGESGAFRAPKGEEFPTCEPREGHCGNVGAKGQWGSPHETEISSIFIGLRVFAMSNLRNSSQGTIALILERNILSTRSATGAIQKNRFDSLVGESSVYSLYPIEIKTLFGCTKNGQIASSSWFDSNLHLRQTHLSTPFPHNLWVTRLSR